MQYHGLTCTSIIRGQQQECTTEGHYRWSTAHISQDRFYATTLDAVQRVNQVAPRIPILILCPGRDEDVAKLAVQRGALDYLLKAHLDRS
jgi:DNA-binding NtrC family response regulator